MKDKAEAIFKPRATSAETKSSITTHVARSIIGSEVAEREAKTARLKAARLARDEAANTTESVKPLKRS